jgi:putative phosphoesterase
VILGLLSDTHGRVQRTAAALRLLRTLGAERIVHCGDVGGEDVLTYLAHYGVCFVWGNTDSATVAEIEFARSIGLSPPDNVPLRLQFDRVACLVFHGHERPFEQLLRAVQHSDEAAAAAILDGARYVFSGHTHAAADVRAPFARFINPGALHRALTPTVATLDLDSDSLQWWEVDDANGPPRPHHPH